MTVLASKKSKVKITDGYFGAPSLDGQKGTIFSGKKMEKENGQKLHQAHTSPSCALD